MSTPSPVPDIRGTITLAVPAERASAVFTGSFGTWWPREYHIGQRDGRRHRGAARRGRWYEGGTDGSECDWGRMLARDPPHRPRSPGRSTASGNTAPTPRTPARSRSGSPGRRRQTTVGLEHRHLGRLAGGRALHDAIVFGGGGWNAILGRFAQAADTW